MPKPARSVTDIPLAIARRGAPVFMALVLGATRSQAQVTSVEGEALERLRESQLVDTATAAGFLLRSMSSLHKRSPTSEPAVEILQPTVLAISNSFVPFSLNDGGLWAGRGGNLLVRAGAVASWWHLQLLVAPELTWSENKAYPMTDTPLFGPPHDLANPTRFTVPAGRSPFASPFHPRQQSIDLPIRFGTTSTTLLRTGQSTLVLNLDRVALGVSSENEWWGPGRQNALVLSDNAPGFPHLFVRTSKPVQTSIGSIEARWLVGGLSESPYFDTNPRNNLRSISMAALTLQPAFEPNLTMGLARSVYAPASGWIDALGSFAQVFADVGAPNAKPLSDTTTTQGRDQLMSSFFRWIFPADGLEVYGEWGRAEFPASLRDFLLFPNHTQAYVLGMQWLSAPVSRLRTRLHAYAETTYLEQSTTYRYRPMGSWYTSRAVEQGYTNEGQVLGAAIGPGSDSQLIGVDFVANAWRAGLFVNRIRWLEDVHSQQSYDVTKALGVCEHDVSLLPGARVAASSHRGHVGLAYSSGWRRNTFFENSAPYCFLDLGRNYRNRSLILTFTPAL